MNRHNQTLIKHRYDANTPSANSSATSLARLVYIHALGLVSIEEPAPCLALLHATGFHVTRDALKYFRAAINVLVSAARIAQQIFVRPVE
jgi:hypothetical protein